MKRWALNTFVIFAIIQLFLTARIAGHYSFNIYIMWMNIAMFSINFICSFIILLKKEVNPFFIWSLCLITFTLLTCALCTSVRTDLPLKIIFKNPSEK